jgi:hypothetical protein
LLTNFWPGNGDHFTDKIWIAAKHGVSYGHVQIIDKPQDCDFMHAPMGSKGCSYQQQAVKVDDVLGSTPLQSFVYVRWMKVKD